MTLTLRGIIPPLVTPFDSADLIDESTLRSEIDYQLGQGVHGICVTGSTGEGAGLSIEESVTVARTAADAVAGRVPVIAGIIQNSTAEVIRYGKAIAETGVDALQVTPVHYLFSPDEESTVDYYRMITEQTGLPVVIYNVVPWARIAPSTVARILNEVPGVIAVKQSGGDIHALADLIDLAPTGGTILSAVDDLLYPSFQLGADGAVAGVLTVAPGLCVQLWDAVRKADHEAALDLHGRLLALWRAVDGTNMPARAKECLRLQGRPAGIARSPMSPVTAEQSTRIEAAVARARLRP